MSRARHRQHSLVVSALAIVTVLSSCEKHAALDGQLDLSDREQVYLFVGVALWQLQEAGLPDDSIQGPFARTAAEPAAASTLYVPTAGHLSGAGGTNWRTDLELHNPGFSPAEITLELLEHAKETSAPAARSVGLLPGVSLRMEDVLQSSFAFTGKAALRITVLTGEVVVASRTYNLLGDGNPLNLPAGATFGQFVAACPASEAIAYGDEARLVQLSQSGAARTNLGLINMTATPLALEITLSRADGTALGSFGQTLRAFEYLQIDKVFQKVTSAPIADGYAVVRTTTPNGAFLAHAYVIDALTGDPVTVPATRSVTPSVSHIAAGDGPAYVPTAGNLKGSAGTDWRTDLEVHNPGSVAAAYTIELLRHAVPNPAPQRVAYTLDPGRALRYSDILSTAFTFAGKAALRVTVTGGEVVVTSRTYNLLGEGNSLGLPAGATFGQFVAAYPSADAITQGQEGRLVQLTQSGAARTNLGLVNATSSPITVETALYRADGTFLGAFTQDLQAYEYRQIDRVFQKVTSSSVTDGYAVVHTASDGGAFFAQAYVIDGLTGDPVAIAAQRRQPTRAPAMGVGEVATGAFELLRPSGNHPVSLRAFVQTLTGRPLDALFDGMVRRLPQIVSRTTGGVHFDYGSRFVDPAGNVISGKADLTCTGLTATASALQVTCAATYDGYTVNGSSTQVDQLTWTIDLQLGPGDRVTGDFSVAGGTLPQTTKPAPAAVSGFAHFDTALCAAYPVSGSILVTIGGETATITFTDACDGSFSLEMPSAVYRALQMNMYGCDGLGYSLEVDWIEENGVLTVDRGVAPGYLDITGGGRWSGSGWINDEAAHVDFSKPALVRDWVALEGVAISGTFDGRWLPMTHTYTGTLSYSWSEGPPFNQEQCSVTRTNVRDGHNFVYLCRGGHCR